METINELIATAEAKLLEINKLKEDCMFSLFMLKQKKFEIERDQKLGRIR